MSSMMDMSSMTGGMDSMMSGGMDSMMSGMEIVYRDDIIPNLP